MHQTNHILFGLPESLICSLSSVSDLRYFNAAGMRAAEKLQIVPGKRRTSAPARSYHVVHLGGQSSQIITTQGASVTTRKKMSEANRFLFLGGPMLMSISMGYRLPASASANGCAALK